MATARTEAPSIVQKASCMSPRLEQKVPLPTRLQAARMACRGLQADMAHLFGVSHFVYSKWESGVEPIPAELVRLIEKWIETRIPTSIDDLPEAARPGKSYHKTITTEEGAKIVISLPQGHSSTEEVVQALRKAIATVIQKAA
jgi:DNA-binding XRE family transcriptional regulator